MSPASELFEFGRNCILFPAIVVSDELVNFIYPELSVDPPLDAPYSCNVPSPLKMLLINTMSPIFAAPSTSKALDDGVVLKGIRYLSLSLDF